MGSFIILSLILLFLISADSHLEGFHIFEPPTTILSTSSPQSHVINPPNPKPSSLDFWDDTKPAPTSSNHTQNPTIRSFTIEILSISILIIFAINYFCGKKQNETLALAWATKFASTGSIFENNFSLLGSLKQGQNVFMFYASGRRFCQGLLATMDLKSRHHLIARLYNIIVPCKDEITFEVYMNDDVMDHVVFALANKKQLKLMNKEFGSLMPVPSNRKWIADDLAVVTHSKDLAGDFITEAVLDQVFGEKAFDKFQKFFISMHFSDQHPSSHRKILIFKFALPAADQMADMTRLVALIPYYIDLIGRYKLSSQARSKPEAARAKLAQEVYKELQYARQEAIQRKKAGKKKMMEEAE